MVILHGAGSCKESHYDYARALDKAGVVFIGPGPEAIAAMGDKIESKKLARAAGVSSVPGHLDVIPDAEAAIAIARDIGYPVIVKAAMGGGGRGMRVVRDPARLHASLEEAQSEARSAFGDASVFLEKYLPRARHLEVQILADQQQGLHLTLPQQEPLHRV